MKGVFMQFFVCILALGLSLFVTKVPNIGVDFMHVMQLFFVFFLLL